jgi:hypothetical protein
MRKKWFGYKAIAAQLAEQRSEPAKNPNRLAG